jgi:hypothetical protein
MSVMLLLAEGVHGNIVQKWLGYANITMTLDLYQLRTDPSGPNATAQMNSCTECIGDVAGPASRVPPLSHRQVRWVASLRDSVP